MAGSEAEIKIALAKYGVLGDLVHHERWIGFCQIVKSEYLVIRAWDEPEGFIVAGLNSENKCYFAENHHPKYSQALRDFCSRLEAAISKNSAV